MSHPLELVASQVEAGAPPCPYAPLIGSWRVTSRWLDAGETAREAEGEWHFGWILGGRGVQDVLFVAGAPARERGTTIRCFDPGIGAWRAIWMQPSGGEFVALVGRKQGDDIVHEGASLDGSSVERWTISGISPAGFTWRGESSADGGETWRLEQEMRASRLPPT